MNYRNGLAIGVICLTSACASIPPEAPALSEQLGQQVAQIEQSHQHVITAYFTEKRRQVDQFVQEVWVPEFAQAFFAGTDIQQAWNDIVRAGSATDRMKLLTLAGPALLKRIDDKRNQLLGPLNALEHSLQRQIRQRYDQMRATNTALTAYLRSANAVSKTRADYLELVGIDANQIDGIIDQTDAAVHGLVGVASQTRDRAHDVQQFAEQIKRLLNDINQIISRPSDKATGDPYHGLGQDKD